MQVENPVTFRVGLFTLVERVPSLCACFFATLLILGQFGIVTHIPNCPASKSLELWAVRNSLGFRWRQLIFPKDRLSRQLVVSSAEEQRSSRPPYRLALSVLPELSTYFLPSRQRCAEGQLGGAEAGGESRRQTAQGMSLPDARH